MITRLVCLSLLALLVLFAVTNPARAQGILPPHPLRLQLGNAKQSNGNGLNYYSLSLDVYKSKKRPKLSLYGTPTFSIYREESHIGYSYIDDGAPLMEAQKADYESTLTAFRGQGISATWSLPLSFQVGVGVGQYTANSQHHISGAGVRASGIGGKFFGRWDLKNGLFTEFATIFPASKRFTLTQISIGKRF
jgi:hypothetical protein